MRNGPKGVSRQLRLLFIITLSVFAWQHSKLAAEIRWHPPDGGSVKKLNLVPEYEDDLERIILFYDPDSKEAVHTQIDLLNVLPDYTRATVVVEQDTDRLYLEQVLPESVFGRVELVLPSDPEHTIWAQDWFEGDATTKLSPWNRPPDWIGPAAASRIGGEFRTVPLAFEGGNVVLARNGRGHSVLFVGVNDYIRTRGLYASAFVDLSQTAFKELVKGAFGVDRVEILSPDTESRAVMQEPPLLHIDQLMLPLADGLMAILSVPSTDPFYPILSYYNEQILAAGFIPVPIQTDVEHLESYQSYVNAVVYTHKETGEKCIIMPVFPDKRGRYRLTGLNLTNKRTFETIGLRVQTVEDRLYPQGGNLHCITLR